MADLIPLAWLPKVRMDRIHLHWTAGHHVPNAGDRKPYHFLFPGKGGIVRGNRSIADNVPPLKTYAAHTRGANSYAIGLSVACMALAKESPLDYGPAPMTRVQFEDMCRAAAQLCRFYDISIGPKTVLWHAEVEKTLGIPQAGKWDATVLPFEPSIKGQKAVGDYTRQTIAAYLSGKRPVAPTPVPTLPPMKTVPTPFDPLIPSPQTGAGGAAGFPESETAGDPEKGFGGRLGLIAGLLVALGLTGAAVYFRAWEWFV